MIHWLSSLSWLQLCWLAYGTVLALLILPVWYSEYHARKVDGASGWILFGWMMLGLYGLIIMLLLSGIYWFLNR